LFDYEYLEWAYRKEDRSKYSVFILYERIEYYF